MFKCCYWILPRICNSKDLWHSSTAWKEVICRNFLQYDHRCHMARQVCFQNGLKGILYLDQFSLIWYGSRQPRNFSREVITKFSERLRVISLVHIQRERECFLMLHITIHKPQTSGISCGLTKLREIYLGFPE